MGEWQKNYRLKHGEKPVEERRDLDSKTTERKMREGT